jgi:hypothetical protein
MTNEQIIKLTKFLESDKNTNCSKCKIDVWRECCIVCNKTLKELNDKTNNKS